MDQLVGDDHELAAGAEPGQEQGPQLADEADPAAALLAAVHRHETQTLLSAKGLGAAAIQAGRKRALQRHYGRQKKSGGGGGGGGRRSGAAGKGSGMQAKLQLVAVGSKRAKK